MTTSETLLDGGILVAVDGTDLAEAAFALAAEIARRFGTRLEMVTVLDKQVTDLFARFCEGEHVTLDEAVEAYQRRIVARALEDGGVAVERHIVGVSHRSTDAAIVETAARTGVSMVVIGSHGRSGARRLVMGSVAEAVARHAPVPVLITRSVGS